MLLICCGLKAQALSYSQVIAVVKSFRVFPFSICHQTVTDLMSLWEKCSRYPAPLKTEATWAARGSAVGEQGLAEQKAVDCEPGCALGEYFMLADGTVLAHIPSLWLLICYLLWKPDWLGKLGAEAVVVFYSSWPCSPLTALCLVTSHRIIESQSSLG